MKCYIITLKEENISSLVTKLKNNNMKPLIYKGINGKSCSNETIREYVSDSYSLYGPKSAIGCGISHIKLWKDFLDSPDEYLTVFEDDIVFEEGNTSLLDKIKTTLKATPKDFDILYLGSVGSETIPPLYASVMYLLRAGQNEEEIINKHVKKPKLALATHAYILSKKGAEKLVKELYGKLHNHIDYCIQNLVYNKKINMYSASPRLIYQTSMDTMNSTNVKSSHPKIISDILSSIYLDDYVPFSYVTSVSIAQIKGININIISILFLIAGIICAIYKINLIQLIGIFTSISILDLFDGQIDIIGFHLVLFIIPSLIGKSLYF